MTVPSPEQLEVCVRFGVRPSSPLPGEKVGAALSGRTGVWPLNGLRHPPALVAPGVEDVWYDEKLLQVLRPGTRW